MKYGWRPDKLDKRDWNYSEIAPTVMWGMLPSLIDLESLCSPVDDQGQLSSCTAHSLIGHLEFLEIKDKVPFKNLSRLMVYYYERLLEGTIQSDAGAELRDGIKALVQFGTCVEELWPYDITKFAKEPPIPAVNDANNHKILEYYSINSMREMKKCISDGFPFCFGFSVYESFESDEVAQTGIVPIPNPAHERMQGGHAVLAVGYNDAVKRFKVRNSWGPDWGQKGYFELPYVFFTDPDLSSDFWTIRRGVNI